MTKTVLRYQDSVFINQVVQPRLLIFSVTGTVSEPSIPPIITRSPPVPTLYYRLLSSRRPRIQVSVLKRKTAKLSMIDLAGSEKGTATGHKGARFREELILTNPY